jgi:hypothetical protein
LRVAPLSFQGCDDRFQLGTARHYPLRQGGGATTPASHCGQKTLEESGRVHPGVRRGGQDDFRGSRGGSLKDGPGQRCLGQSQPPEGLERLIGFPDDHLADPGRVRRGPLVQLPGAAEVQGCL